MKNCQDTYKKTRGLYPCLDYYVFMIKIQVIEADEQGPVSILEMLWYFIPYGLSKYYSSLKKSTHTYCVQSSCLVNLASYQLTPGLFRSDFFSAQSTHTGEGFSPDLTRKNLQVLLGFIETITSFNARVNRLLPGKFSTQPQTSIIPFNFIFYTSSKIHSSHFHTLTKIYSPCPNNLTYRWCSHALVILNTIPNIYLELLTKSNWMKWWYLIFFYRPP